MYHIVAINLQSEMIKYSDHFTLFDEVASVINMLPVAQAEAIKSDFKAFGRSLADKLMASNLPT